MNDKWRQEKRGDFGWSVEGPSEIKAFWLAKADFADPSAKASGKIADSTAKVVVRKVAEHAAEITPHPNLASALRSSSLTAFAVSDDLGGGYLVVFPAGIMNFQTIATAGVSSAPSVAEENQSSQRVGQQQSSDTPRSLSATRLASWVSRAFSFSSVAKLAARLASNDDSSFINALTEAVQYGPTGSDIGIRAISPLTKSLWPDSIASSKIRDGLRRWRCGGRPGLRAIWS